MDTTTQRIPPLHLLKGTLQELRDYAETVVAIKAKGDASGQLTAACAAGTALLLRAREQERSSSLHVARLKEESTSQRTKLDHESLQLHNLLYEQQYYDKETAACRAFTSAYTQEQIGIPGPQQEYTAETERLLAELQQRQVLQEQLQQVLQQKEQLLKQRNRVASSYADLRQQVEQCHTANKALVDASQPISSNIQGDAEAAQLLPLPLYIIYTQAAAAANVVGLPLAVSIEGNPAVAKQQQQQQQQPGGDDAAAAAAPPQTQQDAKRKRKNLQQEDQAYQLHPLSVRLDMHLGPSSARGAAGAVTFTFFYYSLLKLVGVLAAAPEDQELLTNLFLGDVGDGLMLENVGVCSSGSSGPLEFAAAGRPCPFRWAQELGGVDVLASLPSSVTGADTSQMLSALSAYRSALRLETFVDRVVQAKTGRQELKPILEQLARKEQPACSLNSKGFGRISTNIHSWKHVSDVGVQLQLEQDLMQLEAGGGSRGAAGAPAAWQQQVQQHSIQEEGEVAGDGVDGVTSHLLLHGDTAEEDLLQGLLDDDRGAGGAAGGGGPEEQQAGGTRGNNNRQLLLLEHGEAGEVAEAGEVQLEDGAAADAYIDADDGSMGLYPEASGGSEVVGDADDAAGGGASGAGRRLVASHSLYRLVLKAPALEVHFHVKVYYNYPLCPPLFTVTKMLDASQRGDPVVVSDVNGVLKLQQQANQVAVQYANATSASQLLAVQVLQLRKCIDAMSAQLRGQHSKDPVDILKAKQWLHGRERQARLLAC